MSKMLQINLKRIGVISVVILFGFIGWFIWRAETSMARNFKANHQAFSALVSRWQNTNNLYYFSNTYWDRETFVWNETHITQTGSEYEIYQEGIGKVRRKSLEEVAAIAATSSDELKWWKDAIQKLGIESVSTVGTSLPLQQQYVEIVPDRGFCGAFVREGFIYVPDGRESLYTSFLDYAYKNMTPPPYKRLSHIEGRWFYFKTSP